MVRIENLIYSFSTSAKKFVNDCIDLKNYSTMKHEELQKKVTSIALRVLASAIVVAGIYAFTAGSAMICGVHSFTALVALLGKATIKSLAISALGLAILIPTEMGCNMALTSAAVISHR